MDIEYDVIRLCKKKMKGSVTSTPLVSKLPLDTDEKSTMSPKSENEKQIFKYTHLLTYCNHTTMTEVLS